MNLRFPLILILLVIFSVQINAQPITFEKYYDYGYAEEGNCVQQTFDRGYIVAGRQGIAIGVSKIILLKTDSVGQTVWSKLLGGPNNNYAFSVRQTADSGFILTGFTTGLFPSDYDLYIIRTNSLGDTLWTKKYGPNAPNEFDCGYEIEKTFDGGFIIGGQTGNYGWLLKVDANGDTLWTKRTIASNSNGTGFYSVKQTSDSGFIATGVANYSGTGNDILLVRMDTNGDTLWTKNWASVGTGIDRGQSVQQTSDGGFIITGYIANSSYDVYLIKTDVSGNTTWAKSIGDSFENSGSCVQQTTDGGYIIIGTTYFTNMTCDVYLIKTNSIGDTLWTKTFGSPDADYGIFVRQTQDGGFILTGMYSVDLDLYLVKTDSSGFAITGINDLFSNNNPAVLIFPNPVAATLTISLNSSGFKDEEIFLFDNVGRLMRKFNMIGNIGSLDLTDFENGLYLLQIISENKILASKKIIIQH